MRDIEFRAWHLDGTGVHTMHNWSQVSGSLREYIEDSIVMQYTGLKDKNGVKIFEGDVTKHSKGYIWTVVFQDGESRFALKCKSPLFRPLFGDRAYNLEVIGNIHENPELINQ